MRRSTIISSLLLGGSLAVGGFMLAPSFADDVRTAQVGRTAQAGERPWLSIQKVLDKLEAAGYRDFEKIEREHGNYEIRAVNRNGERTKLYVNPQTGDIVDQASRGKRDKADGQRGGAFADCNERRCRDDLPQKTMQPAPAAK